MARPSHQGQLAGASWNPGQYLRFGGHRLRPALELLQRVTHDAPRAVHDLGCGSGEVTRLLAERWPDARVVGVDSSPEMIARASSEPSSVHWVRERVEDWRPDEAPDVIYSNAALHWVDGHDALFPRLVDALAPAGCLAVQMPMSFDLPSHGLMRTTLANGGPSGSPIGSRELRDGMAHRWVASASHYFDLLSVHAKSIDVWETEYLQILDGEDPVLEWVKGTGLRPILNALEHGEREAFLHAYRARLREAYPVRADGRTLYPFRRLFLVATH